MMNEEKKEEGTGMGKLMAVVAALMIILVGAAIFMDAQGKYWMADDLRERLDERSGLSDDYKQGWLDCVDYYLHLAIGATNMTGSE